MYKIEDDITYELGKLNEVNLDEFLREVYVKLSKKVEIPPTQKKRNPLKIFINLKHPFQENCSIEYTPKQKIKKYFSKEGTSLRGISLYSLYGYSKYNASREYNEEGWVPAFFDYIGQEFFAKIYKKNGWVGKLVKTSKEIPINPSSLTTIFQEYQEKDSLKEKYAISIGRLESIYKNQNESQKLEIINGLEDLVQKFRGIK